MIFRKATLEDVVKGNWKGKRAVKKAMKLAKKDQDKIIKESKRKEKK